MTCRIIALGGLCLFMCVMCDVQLEFNRISKGFQKDHLQEGTLKGGKLLRLLAPAFLDASAYPSDF